MFTAMLILLLALALQDPPKVDAQFVKDITDRMKTTRVSAIELTDAPIEDLVRTAREYLNCNFVVSSKVREKHLEEELRVTVRLKDVSVQTLLRVVLKPKGLTVTVRDRVLMVVPQEEIEQQMVTRIYDVRDLLNPLTSFTPPPVPMGILGPVDGRGGGGVPYSSIFSGFSEGGDSAGGESRPNDDMPGTLRQLIETHTGEGSWEANDKASLSYVNGMLVITQNEKTHKEIGELLQIVRRMR